MLILRIGNRKTTKTLQPRGVNLKRVGDALVILRTAKDLRHLFVKRK